MRPGNTLYSTYLAKVELSILLGGDTLDLNEGGVGTGVALSALVADNASLGVESSEEGKRCEPFRPSRRARRGRGGRGQRLVCRTPLKGYPSTHPTIHHFSAQIPPLLPPDSLPTYVLVS